MNPDDILRMAREADRWATNQTSDTYEWNVLRDERFAALVATAVREECTKTCEYRAMPRPLHQSKGEQIMNTEQERTEFEAWYRLHHGSRDVYGRDASGEYADKQVQGAFNVWQARAALTAQDAALLRQALEALELHATHHERGCVYLDPIITALRERLGLRYESGQNEGGEP